jgi:hypothetical protein
LLLCLALCYIRACDPTPWSVLINQCDTTCCSDAASEIPHSTTTKLFQPLLLSRVVLPHPLHCIIEPPYLHLPPRSTAHPTLPPTTPPLDRGRPLCRLPQPSYPHSLLFQPLFLFLTFPRYCASFAEVLSFLDLIYSDAHLSIADSGDTYRPVSKHNPFKALPNPANQLHLLVQNAFTYAQLRCCHPELVRSLAPECIELWSPILAVAPRSSRTLIAIWISGRSSVDPRWLFAMRSDCSFPATCSRALATNACV